MYMYSAQINARLPLRHAAAAAFALAATAWASNASAEGAVTVRGASEVSAYQDTTATAVLTPTIGLSAEDPTRGWGVNGRYLVDVVSAASPDIVSTASRRWVEVRNAGNIGAKYKPGTFGVNLGGSASYTPDYLSLGLNAGFVKELDDKHITLSAGYSFGRDTIGRTGTSFSEFSRKLTYHSINGNVSLVMSKSTVLTLGADFTLERGDQSKPYRYIPLFTADVAATIPAGASGTDVAALRLSTKPLEQLPLGRERYAVSARLATKFKFATLRADERIYVDSWGLKATTTDIKFAIDASKRVIFWPHIRAHYQTPVSFWKRAYVSTGPQLAIARWGASPTCRPALAPGSHLAALAKKINCCCR
jgi:hypothetical protein